MGAHALLSPSAAHRWLNCTAAPRLESRMPEESSTFAEEGTLAHAYCALKLKTFLGCPVNSEKKEIAMLQEQYHTGEMDEYTDTYSAIVLERLGIAREKTADAMLLVETRLDFSDYIPEAFGTADAIIISDGTMEVIDFKYGKGVKVSAVENPQMMIYALGAYQKFSFEYKIERIRMTIIQPRIDNLSEYELSVEELSGWAENVLRPKAKEAFSGKGKQVPGDWCRFCKIRSCCKALADTCVGASRKYADPRMLTEKELAENVLPVLPTIKTWLSGVEEYALTQALAGVEFPGWKIVEGRSSRKITDTDGAAAVMREAGYQDSDIFKPTEMRTITDLEKLVGKKKFGALLADYIIKPEGKPTLVPESDKRAAFNPALDDFKDINI